MNADARNTARAEIARARQSESTKNAGKVANQRREAWVQKTTPQKHDNARARQGPEHDASAQIYLIQATREYVLGLRLGAAEARPRGNHDLAKVAQRSVSLDIGSRTVAGDKRCLPSREVAVTGDLAAISRLGDSEESQRQTLGMSLVRLR